MKKRLALITYSGLPDGAESERLMLPHLAAANIETEIVDWRTTAFDFSKFDLIVPALLLGLPLESGRIYRLAAAHCANNAGTEPD